MRNTFFDTGIQAAMVTYGVVKAAGVGGSILHSADALNQMGLGAGEAPKPAPAPQPAPEPAPAPAPQPAPAPAPTAGPTLSGIVPGSLGDRINSGIERGVAGATEGLTRSLGNFQNTMLNVQAQRMRAPLLQPQQ